MKLLVTTTGDERKVACESCIKGHRVAKCQHVARVLFEVRPPGRPLGGCPHPLGKCPGQCSSRYQPAFVVPGHTSGIKTDLEDGSQYVEGRPIEPHEYPGSMRKQREDRKSDDSPGTIAQKKRRRTRESAQSDDSPAPASDVGSHNSDKTSPKTGRGTRSSIPDLNKLHVHDRSQEEPSINLKKEDKLRLGMMGIGGYGSGGDDVAWNGDWPDSTSREEMESGLEPPPAKRNCCCNSSESPSEPSNTANSVLTSDQSSHSLSSYSNLTTPGLPLSPSTTTNQSSTYFGGNQPDPSFNAFTFPTNFHFPSTPLPAVAASQVDPRYNFDDCSCLSEQQCHCYGCAKHPGNPTHQSKNQELWDLQGDQAYRDQEAQYNTNLHDSSIFSGFDFSVPSTIEGSDHPPQYTQILQQQLPRPWKHRPTDLNSPIPYQNVSTHTFEPYILHPSQYYSCVSAGCACGSGCRCVGCRIHGVHQPCDNYAMGNCKCGEGCECYGCNTQHLHMDVGSAGPVGGTVGWGGQNDQLDCDGNLLPRRQELPQSQRPLAQSQSQQLPSSCCEGDEQIPMPISTNGPSESVIVDNSDGRHASLAEDELVDFTSTV